MTDLIATRERCPTCGAPVVVSESSKEVDGFVTELETSYEFTPTPPIVLQVHGDVTPGQVKAIAAEIAQQLKLIPKES